MPSASQMGTVLPMLLLSLARCGSMKLPPRSGIVAYCATVVLVSMSLVQAHAAIRVFTNFILMNGYIPCSTVKTQLLFNNTERLEMNQLCTLLQRNQQTQPKITVFDCCVYSATGPVVLGPSISLTG